MSGDSPVEWSRYAKLTGCVAGIMGCFLVYGLIQEKLMTTEYGPDEVFTNSGTRHLFWCA